MVPATPGCRRTTTLPCRSSKTPRPPGRGRGRGDLVGRRAAERVRAVVQPEEPRDRDSSRRPPSAAPRAGRATSRRRPAYAAVLGADGDGDGQCQQRGSIARARRGGAHRPSLRQRPRGGAGAYGTRPGLTSPGDRFLEISVDRHGKTRFCPRPRPRTGGGRVGVPGRPWFHHRYHKVGRRARRLDRGSGTGFQEDRHRSKASSGHLERLCDFHGPRGPGRAAGRPSEPDGGGPVIVAGLYLQFCDYVVLRFTS
jgi:hypothetical protein